MSDSIWDGKLGEVLEATASPSPTPGGGSIAAVSGAFGLSLVLMALEVTHRKAASDAVSGMLVDGHALLDRLRAHADHDIVVFDYYMHMLGLPKTSDVEREFRSKQVQVAALTATQSPLLSAGEQLKALRVAEAALPIVRANVRSDLLAGADILLGSLKAVLRNVDINLPVLRDEALKARLAGEAAGILRDASACYERIIAG